MSKLHEILAVEGTTEGYFKDAITEMTNLFKNKVNHFNGFTKVLTLHGEETPEKTAKELAETENQTLTTTMNSELDYLAGVVTQYIDVIAQKDDANQRAVADITIDGVVIAANVPATTLLSLENKLKQLRPVLEQIPTLQPGTSWQVDETLGEGVYVDQNKQIRTKTKKGFDFKVLTPATDKHPAQIEKWETIEDIGFTTLTRWTSMISVADKSALLKRFDALSKAVKQARQRANEVEVNDVHIGQALFDYILAK
jgi:isocitrate/isopropylmalate dehydrogenase